MIMATPSSVSSICPDNALQNIKTEEDILDSIKQLLRQKIEVDIRNAAKS